MVLAYQRGVASGTELRLVVTARLVSRVLGLSGLDRLVAIYPSLEAAAGAPTSVLALLTRTAGPGIGSRGPRAASARVGRPVPGGHDASRSTDITPRGGLEAA